MPFAQLPSSPGFVPPQAPSWAPFALQATQNIEKGGELRMAAGKEFSDSISKAADQISGILKYNSPAEQAKRRLEMLQTQAMTQTYNDYLQHPEKYQLTAHGPMLKDPFEQAAKIAHYRNAVLSGDLAQLNIADKKSKNQNSQVADQFRDYADNVDLSGVPTTGNYGPDASVGQPVINSITNESTPPLVTSDSTDTTPP